MAVCGICKKNRKPVNRWTIQEKAVDNSILRDFKLCDTCGGDLVRRVLMGMSRDNTLPDNIHLHKSGLVNSIVLGEDNVLEVTLSMDLAKARKIVLDNLE